MHKNDICLSFKDVQITSHSSLWAPGWGAISQLDLRLGKIV